MNGEPETSQLDRHSPSDRALLLALSLTPGFLLLFALVGFVFDPEVGVSVFGIHVVAQFMVLIAYAAILSTDTPLGGIGKVTWAFAFLFAAPAALPLYWWVRIRRPVETPHFDVVDVDLGGLRSEGDFAGTHLHPAATRR